MMPPGAKWYVVEMMPPGAKGYDCSKKKRLSIRQPPG
jgi:hypothetical protein